MKFHISILDVLNSKTRVKIIGFLLAHEASMSEREIASVLKVSHMSINRVMRELADLNFVDFVTIGKAHLWKVNRKSYAYKLLFTLLGGVSEIKGPMEYLKNMLMKNIPAASVKRIVLFGSVASGMEKTDSDIDVYLLVKTQRDKDNIEPLIENMSNLCFETFGNRLAPYILTEKELRFKNNLKIISEINKGIQIFPKTKG